MWPVNPEQEPAEQDASSLDILADDDAVLTGASRNFKKSAAIFDYIGNRNYQLSGTAAIDDYGSNIKTLQRIRDGGGIAIGFSPTKSHMPAFEAAKIPVLRGEDLRPFAEIVFDRRKVKRYC